MTSSRWHAHGNIYLVTEEAELPPKPEPGARERWSRFYDERGAKASHEHLAEVDPEAAVAVHENDRRRVVRALELAAVGASLRPPEDRLWAEHTRRPTLIIRRSEDWQLVKTATRWQSSE